MNMKIMTYLIPRHWKYAEKQKSYVSDMKWILWMTDENDLCDEKNQMPGQYRKTVQKQKKTKEERSVGRGRF